jgi:hypothetical protein
LDIPVAGSSKNVVLKAEEAKKVEAVLGPEPTSGIICS